MIDWNWADLNGLKPVDRITHPTPDTLVTILNEQRDAIAPGGDEGGQNVKMSQLTRKKKKAKKILIIMDDAIAESKLINSPQFLKLFIQGRHYNICSMICTQSYVKVPRSVRIQATHVSMFPSRSSEIERIYADFGPKELSKKEFVSMVQVATTPAKDDSFPFLYVDVFARPEERFRRNFTHRITKTPSMKKSPQNSSQRKRKRLKSDSDTDNEHSRPSDYMHGHH